MSRGSVLFCPPLSGAQEKEEVKELLLPQLWLTQGTEQHVTVFLVPQNIRTVRHKEILASNHPPSHFTEGRTLGPKKRRDLPKFISQLGSG